MSKPEPESEAKIQGRQAWADGLKRESNPYAQMGHVTEHYEWINGWLAARADALEALEKEFEG